MRMTAVGEASKQGADIAKECLEDIMKAMPKSKMAQLFGEFNELAIFIANAKAQLPDKPE